MDCLRKANFFNLMKVSLFLFSFFVFFLNPILLKAATDSVQQRCWLKDNCQQSSGSWEKDILAGGCAKNPTNWSCQNCDDVGGQPTARCFAPSPSIPLEVGIPGVSERYCSSYVLGKEPTLCTTNQDCQQKGLGTCQPGIKGGFSGYLAAFYNFFIAALAVISVVMIMWGGFKRIMAAGNAESIKGANQTIMGAIVGLIIALISYSLLQLINPALVKNTMPGIEMIKPEVAGFCPKYNQAKSLYDVGYNYFECVGGSFDKLSCFKDEDCKPAPGESKNGTCVEKHASGSPGNSCGKKFILGGSECIGLECQLSSQGCFKNSSRPGFPYACSNYLIAGKLTGIKVNYIKGSFICNDTNLVSDISSPNAIENVEKIDVEDRSYYTIQDIWEVDSNVPRRIADCNNHGGFKGIALFIERESEGFDDWYAVDASTCGTTTKRLVDKSYNDDPTALSSLSGLIDWTQIDKAKLFQPFDNNGNIVSVNCDLFITDKEFPDR